MMMLVTRGLGITVALLSLYSVRGHLLELVTILLLAGVFAAFVPSLPGKLPKPIWLTGFLSLWLLFLIDQLFGHTPILLDSVVQVFQARIFTAGHLTATAPALPQFFSVPNMLVEDGRWYSQYPPGYPALLALGILLGAPWVVDFAATLLSAIVIYAFTRRVYGERTGCVAFALTLISPFFTIAGVSGMSHTPALLFLALMLLSFQRWEENPSILRAVMIGGAFAAAFLCRPYSAMLFSLPFALSALRSGFVNQRGRELLSAAAGASSGVVGTLFYNRATTGQALSFGYTKLWGAEHGLGFHKSPWGFEHTPLRGITGQFENLALLNEQLLEWPIPIFLIIGVALATWWDPKQWDRRLIAAFLLLPAGYLFYWHRDTFLGPRYLYEGLAALIPLLARAITVLLKSTGQIRGVGTAQFCSFGFLFSFAFAVFFRFPPLIINDIERFAPMRVDVRAQIEAAGVHDAIVFVPISWGGRIISGLRGLGVSASLVEEAYQRTDHCLLSEIARSAPGPNEAARTVKELLARGDKVVRVSLNGDRSLRLRQGIPLSPVCAEEIEYDRRGYTTYLPYFVENDPFFRGSIIYAIDLRRENQKLLGLYPDKKGFIVRSGKIEPLS